MIHNRFILLCVAIVLEVGLCLVGSNSFGAETEPNVQFEEIVGVWKEAERSIETGKIEWTESRFCSADPSSSESASMEGPTRDTEFNRTRRFVFRGTTFRFSDIGEIVMPGRDSLVPYARENIWNGLVKEDLTYHGIAGESVGTLTSSAIDAGSFELMQELDLVPLVFGVRPLQWGLPTIHNNMVVSGDGYLGDVRCVILVEKSENRLPSSSWVSLWLDPDMGFAVRRFTRTRGGNDILRVDIDYKKYNENSFFPYKWTILTFRDSNAILEQVDAKATLCSINAPVVDDDFRFSFPAGTVVHDKLAEPTHYIVEPAGTKKALDPGEWSQVSSFGYERKGVSSEIVVPTSRLSWLVRVLTVAIVIILFILVCRRRLNYV